MRIALISDIHGNYVSLEAVLADIEAQQVDRIICLGDVATIGPQPIEVITRLQELECDFIAGNHETDVLNNAAMEQRPNVSPMVVETVKWCTQQLSEEQLDFLRSFQATLEIQLEKDTTLLCFHGSPHSNTDIILATTPADELETLLAGRKATILAGGHTHAPMIRRYKGTLLVNPGSVGEPLEQWPTPGTPRIVPWAEYATIDVKNGNIGVELRRVSVDVSAIRQASLSSTNPVSWADLWLSQDQL